MKRLLVIADLHCGSIVGLTPPQYQSNNTQKELWDEYILMLTDIGEVDILVVNGDSIDGRGKKNGGSDLITPDRQVQCEMAKYAINQVKAKEIYMTLGTRYHTGEEENWETVVANNLDALCKSRLFLNVHGVLFDFRHKIGTTQTPYARQTPLSKENVWNILWKENNGQEKPDIIVRSHAHYFSYAGGNGWLGVITPALQGFNNDFGSRNLSSTVDFGMVWFNVYEDGKWSWNCSLAKATSQKIEPIKIY